MKRRINVIRTSVLFYFLSMVAACTPWGANYSGNDSEVMKTTPPPPPVTTPKPSTTDASSTQQVTPLPRKTSY